MKGLEIAEKLIHVWRSPRRQTRVAPQPDWMRELKVGDVLETRNGKSQRTVRAIAFYACGALKDVTFTIRHCSWTHRCETVLTYTDLISRGFTPTGHRRKLNTAFDRKIARCIVDIDDRSLDCCDVRSSP